MLLEPTSVSDASVPDAGRSATGLSALVSTLDVSVLGSQSNYEQVLL